MSDDETKREVNAGEMQPCLWRNSARVLGGGGAFPLSYIVGIKLEVMRIWNRLAKMKLHLRHKPITTL